MVASPAQVAANRANALASTGPRSLQGKAASSRNALTHGANASDDTILAAAPTAYLASFHACFQPADALEEHLVEHLAVLAARRDRLNAAVEALLELNERHALTECLHERYSVQNRSAYIPGQPAWQATMRRYDGNTYTDEYYTEPVSDPALDPDPALCSLAYTLSSPRAATLFRHEAAVDRRFHTALKELTTVQAQRRASPSSTPPATPLHEPRLQRALDQHLRQIASPTSPALDQIAPVVPLPPSISTPSLADPNPNITPRTSDLLAPDQAGAPPLHSDTPLPATQIEATTPSAQIEANMGVDQPRADEPSTLQSLLPRLPAPPSGLYHALLADLLPPLPAPKSQDEANPLHCVTSPTHVPQRVPLLP